MIASIIAYAVSAFCFMWAVALLVYGFSRGDIDMRFCIFSSVAFGGMSWVFAYLGGLS